MISALLSFMKNFTTRTGVRTHLAVFKEVDELAPSRRIVLYRVAQETLTNVARHAQASRLDVTIQNENGWVIMEKNILGIHDTAGLTRHAISARIIESSVQVTILKCGRRSGCTR
jgi:signal transduction histidine kinase